MAFLRSRKPIAIFTESGESQEAKKEGGKRKKRQGALARPDQNFKKTGQEKGSV
jgi:hypothetical protein